MNKPLLTFSLILLISLVPIANANLSNTPWIPPTNANSRITTSNGTVHEMNYSSNYNFVGSGSITVTGSNNSKTIYFSGTSSPVNNHQGTYNKTLANNSVINSGGSRINFINGTNNPVSLVNDPTRDQINVTISSTGGGGGGVTSLNALTGALTIACVSGNTTCTTNGLNTITVNTAWNIVTTGGTAQTITKGLTLNALTLGGNAAGGNKNFTALNNVNATKFFQLSNQVVDTITPGAGISAVKSGGTYTITNTGVLSAITSVNSQTGPSISIIRQPSYTTIKNTTNTVQVGIDAAGVMELNGTQTVTGAKTFSGGITMSGSDINLGTNALTNSGHKSTLPLTSGTLCQTNQSSTCGTNSGVTSITGTAHNVTASSSTGAVTLNTGDNVVVTGGSTQIISKNITSTGGITMSSADFTLKSNKIIGTTANIYDNGGGFDMISTPANSSPSFRLLPNGASVTPRVDWFRTTGPNFQALIIGPDIIAGSEYALYSQTSGTGVATPINIYIQANSAGTITKLLSFDVAKTITSYVQNIWTPIADVTGANAIWKSSTNADVLKYRNAADSTTYNILSTLGAVTTSTPADPTGTTSTTAKMMGLAGSITPAVSTRVDMTICGQMANSLINDGVTVQLRYGTGTAPTNGATLTGTQLGASQTVTEKVAAQSDGFCVTGIATGLTIGTAYWMDIGLNAVTAGTATITGNTIKAHEI